MKRILFLSFFLGLYLLLPIGEGWGGVSFAQKGAPEGMMNDIRAKYAEAWEMVKQQLQDDITPNKNYMTATLHYVIPACGQTTETLSYYYLLDDNNESGEMAYNLYLVTRKYNVAVRNFYEEYLYDTNTAHCLFVYKKYDIYAGDGIESAEERYYMHDGQIIWKTLSENAQVDEEEETRVKKACYSIMQGFAYVVNHSF